ncbi:MAG: hypothetical protein WD690_20180 [Vicinamibacterales bacterium]
MKTAPPPSLRDRLLFAGLGLLPRSVASHLLFLLQSHPQLADGWGYHVRPIDQREAFTEQYLLEAFLAFNREFHVKAANFWLAGECADEVKALVPESAWCSDDRGRGSFWMQRA